MSKFYPSIFVLGTVLGLLLAGCASPPPPRPALVFPHPSRYPESPRQPAKAAGPTSPAPNGKELTLAEALALALSRNPGLAGFSWELRAREARALQERLLPNPEVEVSVENFAGQGANRSFDSTETTLSLSQLVQLGGKRLKRYRVAQLDRTAAGWEYESRRLQVIADTTMAFAETLAAQERLRLSEDTLRLSEKVLRTVTERVRAGKVSPLEKIRASVMVSERRIQRERAARNLTAARKRLASLWGSTTPRFGKVRGDLEAIEPIPPEERIRARILRNPDMVRRQVEIEQRRSSLSLAKALRIPDMTVRGGIRRLEENEDLAFVFGVSIPLPIFDRSQGRIGEAKGRLARSKRERQAVEVEIRTAVAEAYQALSSSYAAIRALKTHVLPSAQKAFDSMREGYRQGKFGFLDILDAQRTLFEAREQLIDTLVDYHKAKSRIERLIGGSLASLSPGSDRTDTGDPR